MYDKLKCVLPSAVSQISVTSTHYSYFYPEAEQKKFPRQPDLFTRLTTYPKLNSLSPQNLLLQPPLPKKLAGLLSLLLQRSTVN